MLVQKSLELSLFFSDKLLKSYLDCKVFSSLFYSKLSYTLVQFALHCLSYEGWALSSVIDNNFLLLSEKNKRQKTAFRPALFFLFKHTHKKPETVWTGEECSFIDRLLTVGFPWNWMYWTSQNLRLSGSQMIMNMQHQQNSTEMNSAFTGESKSQMPSWSKDAEAALFHFR